MPWKNLGKVDIIKSEILMMETRQNMKPSTIKAGTVITIPRKGNYVYMEDVETLFDTEKNGMKIMINPELT